MYAIRSYYGHEVARGPNPLQQLEPAHARQHHVEDHEIERCARLVECPLPGERVFRRLDRILLGLEVVTQPLGKVSRITSYNVCYTKLLRFVVTLKLDARAGPELESTGVPPAGAQLAGSVQNVRA